MFEELTKIKILVVDDEAAVLRSLKRILNAQSHEVFISASAEEAMGVTKKHIPDLIIADYNLVTSNGVDLALAIRRSLKKRIPVIIISGLPANSKHAMRHYFRFIQKPFTIKELLKTVDECLYAAHSPQIVNSSLHI